MKRFWKLQSPPIVAHDEMALNVAGPNKSSDPDEVDLTGRQGRIEDTLPSSPLHQGAASPLQIVRTRLSTPTYGSANPCSMHARGLQSWFLLVVPSRPSLPRSVSTSFPDVTLQTCRTDAISPSDPLFLHAHA